MAELEPRQWQAWAVDTAGRPGRLALRRVTLHVGPAASFAWDLTELPQVVLRLAAAAAAFAKHVASSHKETLASQLNGISSRASNTLVTS